MKIAVGIIHGIGRQKPDFHEELAAALARRLSLICPEIELVTEGIYWGDITERIEEKLLGKLAPYKLRWDNWFDARGFMVSFAGDAIAYQPIPRVDNPRPQEFIYTDIHERMARKLQCLARRAGATAPLCLIGHSLGSVIACNYLYDLQKRKLPPRIQAIIARGNTPLEKGETLSHLFTMGSPIALWTLRFDDFGKPVDVPAPKYRQQRVGEWVNFYDKDDIIAFPLKRLSESYNNAVTEDVEVRNPGLMAWTPLGSHGGYFRSSAIQKRICHSLARMYRSLNPQ
ncbi:chemotaxis protein [Paenibacillus soyae]|uniref:Chemotaxis protein n=1 Tax=Paenibacillus soyae TaxID=2969249 RepID=A0A9X2MSY4_9BACL|nr:chemotaxis protein [Paenibacillus soyae]MCR2805860.1 chemotaxis protein [Paenibacillus soyae]